MSQTSEHAIAVIGMAGRFPGSESIEAFWENISESKESITSFSNEDLIAAGVPKEKLQSSHYVKARGVLEGVELFDADFLVGFDFDYSVLGSSRMDAGLGADLRRF